MKKVLLFIFCFLAVNSVSAKLVTSTVASAKAMEIMQSQSTSFKAEVASVTPVAYNGKTAYYVVQFAPQGWTLIAADDCTEPLIGFSYTGKFALDNQPESMKAVLGCFAQRINDRAEKLNTTESGWETGATATAKPALKASTSKADVDPLITVNWNQSSPYNKYCPSNSSGRAIVGCVAVAMAQAMSVAQWPEKPSGEYSYTDDTFGRQYINYDNEPAYNWNDILSGANSKDDVARLLWHCGVALNMGYGIDGSGTQSSYIPTALKRNFSYPSSAKFIKRSSYSGDWDDLIYTELSEGRAVCLSGQDIKNGYGHCFNLDGYQGGAYHVNWGWGGSCNGYFMLNGLKDGTMNMDYSDAAYQSVVIGIRAPSDKPSDITISNLTVQAGSPAGTVVGDVEVVNEATIPPTYTFTLQGTYNAITHRYSTPPFSVVDNQLVTTQVLTEGTKTFSITATDLSGNSVTRSFTVTITSSSGIEQANADMNAEPLSSTYYNMQGVQLSAPQKGVNIVKRKYSDGSEVSLKLIIR